MNFKLFEKTITDPDIGKEVFVSEPQGMLRKVSSVKTWPKIGVGKSGGKIGVYAIDDIKIDETIEECFAYEVNLTEDNEIADITYKIGKETDVLAIGNGSLYNSSKTPNAKWEYDSELKIIILKGFTKISYGDEILISDRQDQKNLKTIKRKK